MGSNINTGLVVKINHGKKNLKGYHPKKPRQYKKGQNKIEREKQLHCPHLEMVDIGRGDVQCLACNFIKKAANN